MVETKLLPHDIEAEQCVLAALILDPLIYDRVAELITGDDFHRKAHQVIWGALEKLIHADNPVELVSLRRTLAEDEQLAEVGGASYLANLLNTIPNAANARYYSRVVRECSLRRQLIQACDQLGDRAYSDEQLTAIMEDADRVVAQLSTPGVAKGIEPIGAILERVMADLAKGTTQSLLSGYPDLDRKTGGFARGELIILAGRPSQGKTALALNIAEYVALKQAGSVLVFSIEMSADQLGRRLLSAGRDATAARLFVDDSGTLTPLQVRAKARQVAKHQPLDLVVIDYVQLMASDRRRDNEHQAILDIYRDLKRIAKELNVPILVLSQMSRRVEQAGREREPKLSDLYGGGEAEADVVIFLHRSPRLAMDETSSHEEVKVIVGKNRNGPTGMLKLIFRKAQVRFESMRAAE